MASAPEPAVEISQSSPPGAEHGAATHRLSLWIGGILLYEGFTMAINGIGAPWIAKSFHLSESGIAGLFAWVSLSAIGALALSRMIDRMGRRRMLLLCVGGTPVCALTAALCTNIIAFAASEIGLYAFIGATISNCIVLLAEELEVSERARGQSIGGLGLALGAGGCLILMPALAAHGYSWRWLLVLASAEGVLALWAAARAIPESRRWERAAAAGVTSASNFYDVFGPLYRRRSIPILNCSLLSNIAGVSAASWGYFHAVSVVGLSPGAASAMMIVGGGFGLLGFPLGARGCERFGRVPTIVASGLLVGLGAVAFYWGPPKGFAHPVLWLGAANCWFTAAQSALQVGGNSAGTELFPTAIRGAMMGWYAVAGAVGSVCAQAIIAILAARTGGLSIVVGYLSLLAIPSALIFWTFIPETRGLSLEAAAMEEAFEKSS